LNLLRRGRPLLVGHRGAPAVAPENTLVSLAAAADAGADIVEFDVGGDLTLAHSEGEVPDDPASLDDALELLAGRGVAAHVDVKRIGIEPQVVDALRRHGLLERAIVSSARGESIRRVGAVAPALPRALGYPYDRANVARFRWPAPLTRLGAGALRAVLPLRLPSLLRSSNATVLALHHRLVSPAVVAAAHVRDVPVFAWTVNDLALLEPLVAAGVDAIVTDDPRAVADALATLGAR
jgi:glycerophosphoryl diester phosphodiesterase